MVLWSSPAFGFIRFSDGFSTGSSIMPQKRNPDAAELVRGKAGRVFGSLIALLTTMKALPLAYNKDMQEDKEPVMDAARTMNLALPAMMGMVLDFTADTKAMQRAASSAYSTATDLADWLVRELKLPFREAHHVTAKLVKRASDKKCDLAELPLSDMKAVLPAIHRGVFDVLSVEQSAASRGSFGGTAPANVKAAIRNAKKRFGL
jgi:argininosuccinate lyase